MAVFNTILLVDDDETTNYLNTRLLRRLELATEIAVVTNGEEALQYLHHAGPGEVKVPELILLDIKMPVMDGFEFMENYEKIYPAAAKNIPIVMLTSSTNPHDLERLKKYPSVIRHLAKPLTEANLHDLIGHLQKS